MSLFNIFDGLLGWLFGNKSWNVADGLINKYTGAGLTPAETQQNEWNAKQAEISYERQLDLFNKTQSIPAQVAQAQQAGVNPAALYGNLSAGSVPSVQQAQGVNPSSSLDLISSLANLMFKNKELKIQSKLAEKQGELYESEAANKAADTALKSEQTIAQQLANRYTEAVQQDNIDIVKTTLEKLRTEADNAEITKLRNEVGLSADQYEAGLKALEFSLSQATYDHRKDYAYYLARKTEYEAKGEKVKSDNMQKRIDAEINQMYASAALDYQNAESVANYVAQYYEFSDEDGKSMFQNMSEEQVRNLQANTEYLGAEKGYKIKAGAKVEKETGMMWTKALDSISKSVTGVAAIVVGAAVGGPTGAAVGAAASSLWTSTSTH